MHGGIVIATSEEVMVSTSSQSIVLTSRVASYTIENRTVCVSTNA